MNDNEFKKLFKSQTYEQPSELHVARWKKIVRRELDRTPSEWARLAVACAIGVVIGASAFGVKKEKIEYVDDDATIERVHVNLE
jgi:hypothetical protein